MKPLPFFLIIIIGVIIILFSSFEVDNKSIYIKNSPEPTPEKLGGFLFDTCLKSGGIPEISDDPTDTEIKNCIFVK